MKTFLKSKKFAFFLLILILSLAAFFRLYGINWDQNQHLHPDERFLTMVSQAVKWPSSISQYLNPEASPLSPYNANYSFFVYGTLPLKIVKYFSEIIILDNFAYYNITLVGRLISAFLDLGVVFLVFLIGKKVFNEKTGLMASFVYAISVLPIQLSHFYAVDTFLVFFLTLSFYFLILSISSCHSGAKRSEAIESRPNTNKTLLCFGLLGISFGLALACKISALLFTPIVGLGFLFLLLKRKGIFLIILNSLFLILASYFVFRLADPRAFSNSNIFDPRLNPQFIANLKQLKSFDNPNSYFPPAIQWLKTKPIIFPLKNLILWGLGLPLGILSIVGVVNSVLDVFKKLKENNKLASRQASLTDQQIFSILIVLWIFGIFTYQGIQFGKTMRYFYPIYPFLSILSANFIYKSFLAFHHKHQRSLVPWFLGSLVLLSLLIWPTSFVSIYSQPHSRVTASEWIYQNIPLGSTLSCEHWDDCLPLHLNSKNPQFYNIETLEMFNLDDSKKWKKINTQLKGINYLVLSSNRVWGSIPKVPEKFPITSEFYEDLLEGKLQFKKVAEFTSYPTIPIFHITISDDSSEEAFTVYDHPKIIIFKKESMLPVI